MEVEDKHKNLELKMSGQIFLDFFCLDFFYLMPFPPL